MSESINDFPHIDYGGTQCLFSLYEQDLLLCCVSLFLSFLSPSNFLFCQIQSSVMPPLAPVKLTQPDTYTRLCHHPPKKPYPAHNWRLLYHALRQMSFIPCSTAQKSQGTAKWPVINQTLLYYTLN